MMRAIYVRTLADDTEARKLTAAEVKNAKQNNKGCGEQAIFHKSHGDVPDTQVKIIY